MMKMVGDFARDEGCMAWDEDTRLTGYKSSNEACR